MPQTIDHKVEMFRLAQSRLAAGLPVWDRKISFKGVFGDESRTFTERRDRIVAILRASSWLAGRDMFDPLVCAVEGLEGAEDTRRPGGGTMSTRTSDAGFTALVLAWLHAGGGKPGAVKVLSVTGSGEDWAAHRKRRGGLYETFGVTIEWIDADRHCRSERVDGERMESLWAHVVGAATAKPGVSR